MQVSLVSYNVLSLLGAAPGAQSDPANQGLHGATGRPSLLALSLEERAVQIAGFQECRTPPGNYRCGNYRRFSSGCDESACFGIELWLRVGGPFRPDTVAVLHADPTALIVSLSFRGSPLRVLVGHAPHRAHPENVRVEWWQRVGGLCRTLGSGAPWIFMLDGNCRFGSITSAAIGDCQPDPEDISGAACHALLLEFDLWVPATFADVQVGNGATLCLHRNGSMVRSDYVCVPQAWRSGRLQSRVDAGITTGHVCIDHLATTLCASLSFVRCGRVKRATRIDVQALSQPENAPLVSSIIRGAPHPPWEMDASEHAAVVVDHLYTQLAAQFPARSKGLRESYFSEQTQELHRAVATLRHSIRSRKTALLWTRLRCAFLAWTSPSTTFCDLYGGRWLWELRHRLALSCLLLHRASQDLRRHCRADRAAFFAGVADEVATRPASGLHHAVKRVMRPKRFRRSSADPLPLLYDSQGRICRTMAESQDAWRNHFGALEDGIAVDAEALVESCQGWHEAFSGTDHVVTEQVPTLQTLEQAFRFTKVAKASGPDLLPPAICHHFSSDMSLLFWPLMLKTVLNAAEAVGLKGGLLHHIPKPSSSLQHTCAGHRAILVQSCIAKAVHRAVRGLAVEQWMPHALPVQLGGRKGCTALFGHFCSRAFLGILRDTGRSGGILFVDLASAYYRVVRETILGQNLGARGVEDIARSLHLSDEDLQLMCAHIREHPVLEEQASAPLFQEVARELHSHTWFVLANDRQVVRTFRGTRPGGALADIIFNLLFSRVLARRDQACLTGTAPQVPWDGLRAPVPASSQDSQQVLQVQDVVFADDLASFVSVDSPTTLRPALSGVAAATLNVLPEHGMSANLGPTKTAALVLAHGRGSRAVKRALFSELKGRMPVWPEHAGAVHLDLVTSYKHLGSVLTCDGGLLTEIKHRIAVGRAAFREGKQRLFSCKRIPVARRAVLLRSHVMSAVLSGCGAWPWLRPAEWQAFTGGIVSIYRQLLGLRDESWRVTETQIISRTGLSGPQSLLHVERLRFLLLMVRSGPDFAWALLRQSSTYLQAIQAAADWLLTAVGGSTELGGLPQTWSVWESMMKDSPGKFKGLLKRAELWHGELNHIWASLETFCRNLWPPSPPSPLAGIEACTHACLPCGLAFGSRQAWGAHAHRVHGYHHPAHRLAQGRRCRACGLLLATSAKLCLHLKHSPRCLRLLERPGSASLYAQDDSAAHAQAPAEVGPGISELAESRHEVCEELAQALHQLQDATDQQIFDLVLAHVAPLPVLRQTLVEWSQGGLPAGLSEACADVLLVLWPEHLCTKIAGKPAERPTGCTKYCPSIQPPSFVDPPSDLPVCWCGGLSCSWLQRWRFDSLPPAEIDVRELEAPNLPLAAGYCIHFPAPCAVPSSLVTPAACPVRAMRGFRVWLSWVMTVLERLVAKALSGIPVHIFLPVKADAVGPLAQWLQTLQGAEGAEDVSNFCFTFEFIASL